MMADDVATLRAMYASFNNRDIDGVLGVLTDDVEWANGMDGGHVSGKKGVREYWTRQWSEVSPHVEPLSFDRAGGDTIRVRVKQEIFGLDGKPLPALKGLHSQMVQHVFRFKAGRVARFDIEE